MGFTFTANNICVLVLFALIIMCAVKTASIIRNPVPYFTKRKFRMMLRKGQTHRVVRDGSVWEMTIMSSLPAFAPVVQIDTGQRFATKTIVDGLYEYYTLNGNLYQHKSPEYGEYIGRADVSAGKNIVPQ